MPKLCPVCGASFDDANVFCPKDGSALRAAELDTDLIGTVIAERYLVTDLLGEGGMGKVYLARHVRLPQNAAIKVLRPAMLRDPAAIARFNREAANASSIEHEHIARVFDYGASADGTVYLAMEYVPGRTLKKLLSVDGPQSPERTARITRQIGDALDAAHKLGIVHRDLKPDNVMITETADGVDRCKVVDFGISKTVGGHAGEGGLTKTGFVVGTPEFMSPEQLTGAPIDHRSDVFALALLAFQMLTGELPFDSSTPERTITARLVDPPQTLSAVKSDVLWPASLQSAFDRALARDPQQRQESAGRFARELEQAVASWGRDTTALPLPTALLGSAGPGAAVSPGGTNGQTSFAPVPGATEQAAKRRGVVVGAGVAVLLVAALAIWGVTGSREQNTTLSSDSLGSQLEADSPSTGTTRERSADQPVSESSVSTSTADQRAGRPIPEKGSTIATQQKQSGSTDGVLSRRAPEPGNVNTSTTRAPETSSAAKFTLDSIRIALNPATATETDARRAVAALRDLMPRLATAEDSAWGYLRQAEAHFLMADERSACVAINAARPLVRDVAQQGVLGRLAAFVTNPC